MNLKTPKGLNNQGGQVMGAVALLFLAISVSMITGVSSIMISEAKVQNAAIRSREGFFTAESSVEDVAYRVRKALPVSSLETLSLNNSTASTTLTGSVGSDREIISSGNSLSAVRSLNLKLTTGTGAAFFYGVQAGEGGILMENYSSVRGNVYSNGSVVGSGSSIVRGSVVSAGPAGLISGVEATSSAYAHTIQNSYIYGNAYYQTISGTTVLGTSYPGSQDQSTSSLPITDQMIEDWKDQAEAGGTITSPCPLEISSSTTTGPFKIDCDLNISGTPTITLKGPLWVSGNINIQNSSIIKVDPSFSGVSVPIIADNESNRTTSSKIELTNSTVFQGSGSNSYILLLSKNRSAKEGGGETAIDVANSVVGDLLVYAGEGKILIQNNIGLNEVTAWKIHTKNSAEVVYKTGLANLLFSSGPGGGYSIEKWLEIE